MTVTNYYSVGGEILGEKTTGGSRIDYLTDALGSVTATLNQSAQVVNTYRYKPYGSQLAKTGTGTDPAFTWVGSQGYRQTNKKYADVYVRARHYSTGISRWLTRDPLWPAESAYCYALSNPILWYDNSGLMSISPDDSSWPGVPVPGMPWPGSGGSPGTCFSKKPCPKSPCEADPCSFDTATDLKGRPAGGWVACCNGIAYPCVNRSYAGAQPGIIHCLQEHEQCHIQQLLNGGMDCPDCGFQMGYPKPPLLGNMYECECATVQIVCLLSQMRVCARLSGKAQERCYAEYKRELRGTCNYAREKCVKGDEPDICAQYKH